ncbi:MAG: hypothetical protein ABIE03_03355 [Patescibacteria group bacterium]|nr:hypothetical protein [Patescibacteria group bacterium]
MNIATYIEQIAEVLGYVFSDVDREYLSRYSNYIVIAIGALTTIFIITRIVAKMKSVSEYIDNGVALYMKLTDEVNVLNKLIKTIIPELYLLAYENYGRKEYFSLEILLNQNVDRFTLFLPSKMYQIWASRAKSLGFQIVTGEREKFIESMNPENFCTTLELARDYVYSLDLEGKSRISDFIKPAESIFFQLVCRPQGDKWKKKLQIGLEKLKKGRPFDLDKKEGLFGGLVFNFFNILASMITFLVHGSGPTQKEEIENVSKNSKHKIQIINRKLSDYGFEVQCRLVISGDDEERTYFLVERLMDIYSSEGQSDSNFFVPDRLQAKLTTTFKNDLILANIDKSSVDILNEREINRVLEHFI